MSDERGLTSPARCADLYLVGHDAAWAEDGADFVCPSGVEVAQPEVSNLALRAELEKELQGVDVAPVLVVLPEELEARREEQMGPLTGARGRPRTWRRSMHCVCIRMQRSSIAVLTVSCDTSIGLKTAHFVAPNGRSPSGRFLMNWPCPPCERGQLWRKSSIISLTKRLSAGP